MQKRRFHFLTTCVNSAYALLSPMMDNERQVTWRTFRDHVSIEEIRELFPGYSYQGELYDPKTGEITIGFHIKDDFGVSFHKSTYDGVPCYFLCWSAIEFIFI